jgi:hypothetical protein
VATCPLVTVADAIAAEIVAARDADEFDLSDFETEVLWGKRSIELQDRDRLRVDVAPMYWTQSLKTRGSWAWMCRLQVGIRKRYETAERDGTTGEVLSAEIESLVNLTSDVLKHFMPVRPDHTGRRLTSVPTAAWREEKEGLTRVTIDWDSLRELDQFTGWFPLTFEVPQASA